MRELGEGRPGRAALVCADRSRRECLQLGTRRSPHVRHWHKYTSAHLPAHLRFHFRTIQGPLGRSASNVEEFHDQVRSIERGALVHHAAHHDFSRWFRDALQDAHLSTVISSLEASLPVAASGALVERMREQLADAVERRYLRGP